MSNSGMQDVGVVAMGVVVVVVVVVNAVVDVDVTSRPKSKNIFLNFVNLKELFYIRTITWLSAAIPVPAISTPAVVSATFQ